MAGSDKEETRSGRRIGWGDGMGQGGVKRGLRRKPIYNYNVVDLFK
jgi:hypothetical protein